MLNIVTIHAIRKTPSLSKNLKTLLLSLAVSDLGVGLVAQPLYEARLIVESRLNIETYNAMHLYRVPYPGEFISFRYVVSRHCSLCREIYSHSILS